MDLGSAALLELNEAPDGKRLAYCLPTGEFIFATARSARYFANDQSNNNNNSNDCDGNGNGSANVHELYGRNLCQFLAPHDIERLEDYMRGHCSRDGRTLLQSSSELQMMVRVQGTGMVISVRLETVPLTLRMSRCIDAVLSMFNPTHLFADASSFVVSEDDFGAALPAQTRRRCDSAGAYGGDADNGDDDPFFFASPSSYSDVVMPLNGCDEKLWATRTTTGGDRSGDSISHALPLELKDSTPRARAVSALVQSPASSAHASGRCGKRTSSTASTDIADDDDEASGLGDTDDSLAGFAFEAEWASEVAHTPSSSARACASDWPWLRNDASANE